MGCSSSKFFVPSDIPGQSAAVEDLALKLKIRSDDLNIIYTAFCSKADSDEIILDKLCSHLGIKSDAIFSRTILVNLQPDPKRENYLNFQDFLLAIWALLTIRDISGFVYEVMDLKFLWWKLPFQLHLLAYLN